MEHTHIMPNFEDPKSGSYYCVSFNGRGEWTAAHKCASKALAQAKAKRLSAVERKISRQGRHSESR